MNAMLLVVAAATLGIDVGWQPAPGGGLEYIIQIEPQALARLSGGQVLTSEVPPHLRDVRRWRIVVGSDELPRVDEPAESQPEPPADSTPMQPPAADRDESANGRSLPVERTALRLGAPDGQPLDVGPEIVGPDPFSPLDVAAHADPFAGQATDVAQPVDQEAADSPQTGLSLSEPQNSASQSTESGPQPELLIDDADAVAAPPADPFGAQPAFAAEAAMQDELAPADDVLPDGDGVTDEGDVSNEDTTPVADPAAEPDTADEEPTAEHPETGEVDHAVATTEPWEGESRTGNAHRVNLPVQESNASDPFANAPESTESPASMPDATPEPSAAPSGPGGGDAGPWGLNEKWMPLTLVLLGLFASVGANLYMGWLTVGTRHRYRMLAEQLRADSPS